MTTPTQKSGSVAIVTPWLGLGGTEKGLVNHATAIDRERFDVRVVVTKGDGPRHADLDAAGVPVVLATDGPDALAEALRGVDVAHAFRVGLAEPAVPAACRKAGVPHLIETNIFGRIDASSDEPQFDCHLFVGQMCAWRYRERLGLTGPAFHERHRVLHWPIDIPGLRAAAPERRAAKLALGLDPDRPVVGRIGRDDDTKWRRLLVTMVPHLLELVPDVQVMYVGATPDKHKLLRRLGVHDRVSFVDTTFDEAQVMQRFMACDVFVTAAEIGESYSVAISEAMALGLPIVTCSTPWVDNGQIEQVQQGVTGHIADHPRAFAEACADLIADPAKADRFGAAAAVFADERMDRMLLTRQLERLYAALIAGEPIPGDGWVPSLVEVDGFGAEYEQRLTRSFRPLTARERREVQVERYAEQARWALRAARKLDRDNVGFLIGTLRARARRLTTRR
ncbi:glycosyltransferase family 4 protein [Paraconexibacter sp. AEG42_29]|uniref:glycosyltransferase family 4 protein n=1 Tax=Paraconexibacter sp. AEG42_29 TaxID=2997339 RepID=UPI00339D4E45